MPEKLPAQNLPLNSPNELDDEVLDVRAIPHPVRHAAILGALNSLAPGFSLTIDAPHMPTPLLAQVQELPGEFVHTVLQDGPEHWIVRITRTAV